MRACRCMTPTRWCIACMKAKPPTPSRRRFRARRSPVGRSHQAGCARPRRRSGSATAGGNRASACAGGRTAPPGAEPRRPARRSRCSIYPLLFETAATAGRRRRLVSAPPEVQRARVLERPGMTAEKFEAILGKQMPDAEKRRRADFVVDTSQGLDSARAQVRAILDAVATMPKRLR